MVWSFTRPKERRCLRASSDLTRFSRSTVLH